MKISRPETMSGKIRHLENIFENISLRNRGKDRQTEDRGHSCLEKGAPRLKNKIEQEGFLHLNTTRGN